MPIALLIALLIGGGTTIAAEQALPGDALYSVKVGVNENVRSAFAVSNEAQAAWDTRRAERRLEEAEELVTKGKLDAELRAAIEARLTTHLQSVTEETADLEADAKHDEAEEIGADLESSLRAHEAVLSAIESGNAKPEVDALLGVIQTNIDAAAAARVAAESQPGAGMTGDLESAANGKLTATENKLAEVKKYIAGKTASVDAGVIAAANTKIAAAEAATERGKTQITTKAYADAAVSFSEARRIAQEAQVLVATSEKVKIKTSGAEMNASFSKHSDDDEEGEDAENEDSDDEEEDETENTEDGAEGPAGASVNASVNVNLGL